MIAPHAADPRAIDAVVVTYRSASTIDLCLQHLRDAADVHSIRIVDNASDDDTLAIVQRHAIADTRVRFVANPDNPGFGVGCNQGAADGDSPWIAFVNPDCLVEPDTLARLRAHAEAAPPMLVGADLVDESGQRDDAARRRDPDFAALLRGALRMRDSRAQLSVPPDDTQALQRVDAVSGALMLLPRALHMRLGGFDERYRLHAEDLDLCRRARLAGAIVAVANDVHVVHVRGVSSRSRPWFVEWHKHRGLSRYFATFEAARRPAAVRAAVFALLWARFPLAALRAWARSRD